MEQVVSKEFQQVSVTCLTPANVRSKPLLQMTTQYSYNARENLIDTYSGLSFITPSLTISLNNRPFSSSFVQ